MSHQTSGRGHVPELDGIRGVAILLVLVFHFVHGRALPSAAQHIARVGWIGVDLFFVLSGFLITGILLREKDSPDYFRRFYRNRVLRIFPLYYCYVGVVFFVTTVPIWKQLFYWTYFGNLLNATGQPARFMSHFWSLAIEEQFYMLWPLVVFRLPVRPLTRLCASSIVLIVAVRMAVPHFVLPGREFVYTFTPLRCDALLMGALVACLHYRNMLASAAPALRWIALAGIGSFSVGVWIAGSAGYVEPGIARFGYVGADLLSAVAVCAAVLWRIPALTGRFLAFFGKYSYGIYVLHFPISQLLPPAIAPYASPLRASLLSLVIGTALSCAAALSSWRLLERRFLALKELPSNRGAAKQAAA